MEFQSDGGGVGALVAAIVEPLHLGTSPRLGIILLSLRGRDRTPSGRRLPDRRLRRSRDRQLQDRGATRQHPGATTVAVPDLHASDWNDDSLKSRFRPCFPSARTFPQLAVRLPRCRAATRAFVCFLIVRTRGHFPTVEVCSRITAFFTCWFEPVWSWV